MSQTLRILYVSSEDVSRGDGPGVNEREFIRTLYKLVGDNAHFVIPRPAGHISDLPDAACTFYRSHRRHNPLHFAAHLISQARAVGRQLSARDVDLVVWRVDVLPLATRYLVARHDQIPYAIKTLSQATVTVLEEHSLAYRMLFSGLNVALIRDIVSGAIISDVCSRPMIEYFVGKLGIDADRFEWIDNAVDTARFSPAAASEARAEAGLTRFGAVVGYIGSRPSQRGARHLVELAPRLLANHPDLGIVVVGDGPGLDALKDRAVELGVRDKCVFTGQLPFEEVPLYCNALDVGVSISDRADRFAAAELKVRQYLACGKPVVATGGSNEFLEEHGLGSTVTVSEPDGIERELSRWLSLSPLDRDRFTLQARRFACDHLSYEAAVRRRLGLWSDLLHEEDHAASRDARRSGVEDDD